MKIVFPEEWYENKVFRVFMRGVRVFAYSAIAAGIPVLINYLQELPTEFPEYALPLALIAAILGVLDKAFRDKDDLEKIE